MDLILSLIIILFSAILHEIAHGYVAERFGDPTARLMGRLTLNPRKHIDPIMSILLPLVLILSGSPVIFGAAKPVPIDPFNLKEGRKDVALVSLSGLSFWRRLAPSTRQATPLCATSRRTSQAKLECRTESPWPVAGSAFPVP